MAKAAQKILRFFQKREEHPVPPFKQFNYLNLLAHDELNDLIQSSEEATFLDLLPDLSGRNILQIGFANSGYIAQKIFQAPSRSVLFYRNGLAPAVSSPSGSFSKGADRVIHHVTGKLNPLSISGDSCDVIAAPLATRTRLDVTDCLPEFSRVLANGGRLVLAAVHPTLELFLYNQNPSQSVRATNTLESVIGALRKNALFLEDIREGMIDREVKPFFAQEGGEKFYEELKGIPLVLFVRAVKFVRGNGGPSRILSPSPSATLPADR